MTARLSILNGELKGQEFVLRDGANTIGRRSDNHIALLHPTVSRYHAVLDFRGDQFSLRKVTDQGILKVDGQDIENFDLTGEHRLQIGKLLVQFTRYAELPATAQQLLHPKKFIDDEETVDLSVSLAQDQTQRPEVDAIERDALKKFSFKGILQLLAILVLGIMVWKVLSSVKAEEIDPVVLPYKAGEEKLIDLEGYMKTYNINKTPVDITLDHPDVLQARLEPPPLNIIWFKSVFQGDCIVTLLDSAQQPIFKFKFIIREAVESRAEVFKRKNLPEDERINKAKKLMERGALIAKESPYEAFEYYDRALLFLETISTSSPLYFECHKLMEGPQKALEDRLKFLWNEANSYRKNKDYATALQFVEQILSLVKDPTNIDHQRAQIHKKYILRQIKK